MNRNHFTKESWQLYTSNTSKYFFWKDRDYKFVGGNDLFIKLAGLSSEKELIGLTNYDLRWKNRAAELNAHDDKVFASRKKLEFTFSAAPGEYFPEELLIRGTKAPIFDETGEPIGLVGWLWIVKAGHNSITEPSEYANIVNNSTNDELLQYCKELEILNDQLTARNRELLDFTSKASHDLKSPLHLITNFSQIILDENEEKLDEDTIEYLGFIDKSAKRMYYLVDAITDYSRVESRVTTQAMTKVDLGHLVQEKIKNLRANEEKLLRIETHLPKSAIMCHEYLIGEVFYHTVKNAILFNESEIIDISISGIAKDDKWEFSITDNGIGIPKRFRSMIFEPFKRLHSKDAYEGSGVGLSICAKILGAHRGHIWVEDNPVGQGSVFKFTISKFL